MFRDRQDSFADRMVFHCCLDAAYAFVVANFAQKMGNKLVSPIAAAPASKGWVRFWRYQAFGMAFRYDG